jgi:hypothetical protein
MASGEMAVQASKHYLSHLKDLVRKVLEGDDHLAIDARHRGHEIQHFVRCCLELFVQMKPTMS